VSWTFQNLKCSSSLLTLSPVNPIPGIFDLGDHNAAPYAQVRESDKAVMIEVEVPRYHPEELKVECDPEYGILTISGTRHAQHHDAEYTNLVFASTTLGDFRRSFSLSPYYYDIAKFSTRLKHGVFTVIVPKLVTPPPPNSLHVYQGPYAGHMVTWSTPEEFKAVSSAKWPPVIRHESTAEMLTYKCELPPTITKDHIKLSLIGRDLTLNIGYEYSVKSKQRDEHQSLSYTATLGVPEGTKLSDISTALEYGVLTITLAKHQGVPVIDARK